MMGWAWEIYKSGWLRFGLENTNPTTTRVGIGQGNRVTWPKLEPELYFFCFYGLKFKSLSLFTKLKTLPKLCCDEKINFVIALAVRRVKETQLCYLGNLLLLIRLQGRCLYYNVPSLLHHLKHSVFSLKYMGAYFSKRCFLALSEDASVSRAAAKRNVSLCSRVTCTSYYFFYFSF